ncbi:MAG: hypothetical protein ACI9OJ_005107 [Myxococcota bacterium]|jgi:hypothetical protein
MGTAVSLEVCPSGLLWTHGDEGSPKMYPGSDCNGCHEREEEGPIYAGAGTVFVYEDERDDCFGVPQAQVTLNFSDGKSVSALSNTAGNFWFMQQDGPYRGEFEVTVTHGGRSAVADEIHDDMNCGKCHEQDSSPYRITIP